MALLLQPTFFAPIVQYAAMACDADVVFERCDNFQKQTYRNRCYIYGANGKQLLTVPVHRSENGGRQKTSEIKIDNSFSWKRNLIKSLESSYRSSPYFEFYEDDILEIFQKNYRYLMDLNLYAHQVLSENLQLEESISFTDSYKLNIEDGIKDLRGLAVAKGEPNYDLSKYTQVFDSKHGFISNLSILDLLFNEGPNSMGYLQEQLEVVNTIVLGQ